MDHYRLGLKRLGYGYTSAIEVRNTKRAVMYHLVFAPSNNAGRRIMSDIQQRAMQVLPGMIVRERRQRQRGEAALFEESPEELETIAADPASWAIFSDHEPVPFDPPMHRPAMHHEALQFDFGGPLSTPQD
jgi:hypothetical protein